MNLSSSLKIYFRGYMAALVSKQAGVTNQNQNYVYRKRRYITADKRGHLKNRIPYVLWCQSSV